MEKLKVNEFSGIITSISTIRLGLKVRLVGLGLGHVLYLILVRVLVLILLPIVGTSGSGRYRRGSL